ncbi:MAG: FMN-binding protein [Bacilli bacterium]|nr:FMN-binding protein [Bacilli bacterium]
MKKVYAFLLVALVFLVVSCTPIKQGNYKEGTYYDSVQYTSYGVNYVTTAVLYVDKDGLIKSCFIDSTYEKDGVKTTKKVLGDAYGMKETSANIGNIEGGAEWYEQVAVIEDKVVSEQGLDWVSWSDEKETKLDSVSGVTITADTYIDAVRKALDKAKK